MAYKLLLADDSITIQRVVELTLSEEDFDVTSVGDGEAALEIAGRLAPDIVLADVFMPKMDGFELCGRLKAIPSLKDIPVVLLVSTFETFDEAKAASVKADDHLTKPFESAELVSKVKNLVEMKRASYAGAVEAEPVEEAALFGEVVEAAPVDDLWSVVDMSSDDQPLAGATETLTEDELWRRAKLLPDSSAPGIPAVEGETLPWEDVVAVPLDYAEEVAEAEPFPEVPLMYEAEQEPTAVINMDDLEPSLYAEEAEEAVIEPVETAEPTQILTFETLEDATLSETPAPAVKPSVMAVPEDMVREEVLRVAREVLDGKIKQAIAGISREMIEQIVWEVVPELAEEILVREIENLKAGIK